MGVKKRLQMTPMLKAGQQLENFVQLGAEGREPELLQNHCAACHLDGRPQGGAAHPPITAALLAPAWNGVSSLSRRPPSTKFSGWRSRLHSVSSPLFFVPFSLLFFLFPGSSCGKCDTVSIYKVQQLCLGNFNAILFQLCVQCSQLNWFIKENLVV